MWFQILEMFSWLVVKLYKKFLIFDKLFSFQCFFYPSSVFNFAHDLSLFGLRPQRISSPYLLCSHQNIHISYFSLRHILGTIVSFVFLLFLETSIVWKLELVFGEWRFGYIKICRLYPGSPLMTLHQYHLGGCEKYQHTYISIRTTWIQDLVVISYLQLFSHNQISLVSRSHLTMYESSKVLKLNSFGFSSIERQDLKRIVSSKFCLSRVLILQSVWVFVRSK